MYHAQESGMLLPIFRVSPLPMARALCAETGFTTANQNELRPASRPAHRAKSPNRRFLLGRGHIFTPRGVPQGNRAGQYHCPVGAYLVPFH